MSRISDVSVLPPILLENFRKKGWSDEELLRKLNGVIELLDLDKGSARTDDDILRISIFLDFL